MNMIVTAFEGQLATDPTYEETPNGTPVCNGIVLINRRTKNDAGHWSDAEPTRRRIKAWRTTAKKMAQLSKGDTVVVIGNVETEAWTDTETGDKRTSDTVVVDSIGQGLFLNRTPDNDEHVNMVRENKTHDQA